MNKSAKLFDFWARAENGDLIEEKDFNSNGNIEIQRLIAGYARDESFV